MGEDSRRGFLVDGAAGVGLLCFGGTGFFVAGSDAGVVLLKPLILLAVHPCKSSMFSF